MLPKIGFPVKWTVLEKGIITRIDLNGSIVVRTEAGDFKVFKAKDYEVLLRNDFEEGKTPQDWIKDVKHEKTLLGFNEWRKKNHQQED